MTNEDIIKEIRAATDKSVVAEYTYNLFINNQTLIRKWVEPYANKYNESMDDLLQESYFALLDAINGYDESKGKFTTYLNFYVRQKTNKYIYNNALIRYPQHLIVKANKYAASIKCLQMELGREPTVQEIYQRTKFTYEEQDKLKLLLSGLASLDKNIIEDEEITLADTIASDLDIESECVENACKKQCEIDLWKAIESTLSVDEQFIVKNIIVFEKTFVETARELDMKDYQVRTIHYNALRHLRNKNKKMLNFYYELDSNLYKTSFRNWKQFSTSQVENIAIQELEKRVNYSKMVERMSNEIKNEMISIKKLE